MDREKEYEIMLDGLLNESIPFIQPEELGKMDSSYILLDIRTKAEYRVSHIPGARFIEYDEFDPKMVADLPRDTTIILYCAVGYRSEKIGEKMKEMGFQNLRNLYGGIFEWKNNGNEVINKSGKTDSVHTYNRLWSKYLTNGVKVY